MGAIQDVINFYKKNAEGALLGGLLGLAGAWWLGASGADLNFALQSTGLMDNFVSAGTTSAKLALTKVGMALIVIGATVGAIVWDGRKK